MKVLVTGAGGFIGRHTVALLESRGYDVISFDNDPMRLRDMKAKHTICGDIRNRGVLSSLLEAYGPDGVIHLAAQSAVVDSWKDWRDDCEINIVGTTTLAEVCANSSVRRLVYASSGGTVYGEPTELPVSEETPLNPQSPYGISKMAAEFYIRLSGISHAILRYPNVYGPGQDPEGSAGVIGIFIDRIMRNEPCIIYGDGNQMKDYVFVEDIVEANIRALNAKADGVFNIGSGEGLSVNRIHSLITGQMYRYRPPVYEDAREGDVKYFWLNCDKAAEELNWIPTVPIVEGIHRTIESMARGGQVESHRSHAPGKRVQFSPPLPIYGGE